METPPQKSYTNGSMPQKCMDTMRNEKSDVNFIFDTENGIVKVPANKIVLSASSSVFNVMFNGELKEKGDVKIVDASPAAFEEFLRYFYGCQVKPTMEHIAEVLKLADKYDVTASLLSVCEDFLKDHLSTDGVLWGLHLAIKYQMNDLEIFCKNKIQANFKEVVEMVNVIKSGKLELTTNSKIHVLSDEDMGNILPHIFATLKNVVSNLSAELDRSRENRIFPVYLHQEPKVNGYEYVAASEMIKFKLTGTMVLTDVSLIGVSKVTYNISTRRNDYIPIQCACKLNVDKQGFGTIVSINFNLKEKDTKITLEKPVIIEKGSTYAVAIKFPNSIALRCTTKANVPKQPIELTPQISISFLKNAGFYTRSLVSHLYFKHKTLN